MVFFIQKLSTYFRHWTRPQILIFAISVAVVLITIFIFAAVKLSTVDSSSSALSESSQSPHIGDKHSITPTSSAKPTEETSQEGEIYIVEDSSFCDFSYEEIAQFASEREKAQATVDYVQSQLDAEKSNLASVQALISELEHGPLFLSYVDPKTQQYVYGTIEQHEQAVNVDLPHFTESVASLEAQLAQAQALVPALPCSS